MALISNTGTLTITSAAATALGTAANNLSANQWGTVTIGNQLSTDKYGVGDTMLSYSPKCAWDPGRSLLRYVGGVHGSGASVPRHYMGTYVDSTNAWTPSTPSDLGSASTNPAHEYYAYDCDHTNGNVYALQPFIDSDTMRVYNHATGTWSSPYPNNASWTVQSLAVVYHPGLYGGTGGVLVGCNRGIWSLDPRAASPVWNIVLDRINQVNAMLEFPAGVYDPFTSSAYMGDEGGMWRVTTGGTGNRGVATAITLPPITLQPSSQSSAVLTASGNPSNPMILIPRTGGTSYTFNGTSWSAVTTNMPSALSGVFDTQWAAGGCSTHGCIVFIKYQNEDLTSTTMHIWKR